MNLKTLGSIYACSGHWLLAAQKDFDLVFAFEPSSMANNISENYNHILITRDINDLNINASACYADVIAGSPPCSGLCQANPLANPDHPANQHMIKFIEKAISLKPKVILMEMSSNLFKEQNSKIKDKIQYLLDKSYNHVYFKEIDLLEIHGIQHRLRALVIASKKPLDVDELVKPGKQMRWQALILQKPKTIMPYDKNRIPYFGTLCKDNNDNRIQSRIVNDRLFFFTITGETHRAVIMRQKNNQLRFISIEELMDVQGFPTDYKFKNQSINWKSKTIGRGVPIREMRTILQRIQKQYG